MEELTKLKCKACEGTENPFNHAEIMKYQELVPQWQVRDDTSIEREFNFDDFKDAIRFINEVADLAESEGHHPDILLHGWNKIKITLCTHAIQGLSINDFIMAAKINVLED